MIKAFSGFAIDAEACALELRAMTGCSEEEAVNLVRRAAQANPGKLREIWRDVIKPAALSGAATHQIAMAASACLAK